MKSIFVISLLLLVSQSLAKQVSEGKKGDDLTPGRHVLDLSHLPLNTVAEVGAWSILTCGVADPGVSHTLQWYEFAYGVTGNLISSNGDVLSHPQADRYTIITDTPGHYDLLIDDVRLADGGTYLCIDIQASTTSKRQHSAFLTVVEVTPNCSTTINPNGIVLERSYQTHDCVLNFQGPVRPNLTWSGPNPFVQAYVSTTAAVWAGMHFNVTRAMEAQLHTATTNFTGYFIPVPENTADNIPTYTRVHQGPVMFVSWGPQQTRAIPNKPSYEVGDVLTCLTDAKPAASFQWQNMGTLESYNGSTVRVDESWLGSNRTMRCQAWNVIEDITYSENIFINVDVPIPTTPATTPSTPSTTPPPAVSECKDLTGAWVSTAPTHGALCITLNLESYGLLTGLMLNDTDTIWIDIVGRAQATRFDHLGFNGIWPFHMGVSSFVGECHRCHGVEELHVHVVSRTESESCGTAGRTQYTTEYVFRRSDDIRCPNARILE